MTSANSVNVPPASKCVGGNWYGVKVWQVAVQQAVHTHICIRKRQWRHTGTWM